jgi:hypothetical protein
VNEPAHSAAGRPEEEHPDGHVQDRPLPVLAEPRVIEQPAPVPLPVAVAAATGGFLLGVASFVLVKILRRQGLRGLSRRRSIRRGGKRLDVTASRSFLVDVHLLRDR